MAQQINVPGVGLLSFPDGMADADIQAAIHKNFPQLGPPPQAQQEQPSNTWGGAVKGVADAGLALGEGGVVGGLSSLARTFNRVLPSFGSQSDAEIKSDIDNFQKKYTYTPQTAEGKYALQQLSGLTTPIADIASTITGAVVGKDNVPAMADAAASIPFVSRLFGKTAAAVGDASSPVTRAQQLQTLKNAGIRLDSSQEVGGKIALTAKNVANDGPYGSPAAFQQAQAGDYTAAALKEMGINSREATPAVMAAGKKVLKDNYNDVAKRTNIEIDGPLNDTIGAVRYATRALTPENAGVIETQLKDIQTMADNNDGVISGTAYKNLQEQLGDVAKDGGKAPFITKIRQALTGAVERQASPADAKLLAQTNQRYGAMKAIEKAIGDDNQVSPSKLYNAMDTTKGANQSVYGQGPNTRLMDIAQAGKAVLGTNTPNSGTAMRSAGLHAATQAGGALLAAANGHWEVAGALAATAAATGLSQKAAQALIYTPAGKAFLQKAARAKLAAGGMLGPAATAAPLGVQTAGNTTGSQQTADSTSP